jgi:hypothetical protein
VDAGGETALPAIAAARLLGILRGRHLLICRDGAEEDSQGCLEAGVSGRHFGAAIALPSACSLGAVMADNAWTKSSMEMLSSILVD